MVYIFYSANILNANGSWSAGNKTGMALVVSDTRYLQRHLLHLIRDLYKETKYAPVLNGYPRAGAEIEEDFPTPADPDHKSGVQPDAKAALPAEPTTFHHELDLSIPMNSWRKRLALWTPTPEPIWPYFYRPFYVLSHFPTVLFTGLQYASGVVWLTITANVMALVFPMPPYLFTPEQIGFMSLSPFVGNLISAFYGGLLGDRSILYFSRKNKGFYEPEMRFCILHLPALLMAGGLIMFGITVSRVAHTSPRHLSLPAPMTSQEHKD